jgi:hypothetical protein
MAMMAAASMTHDRGFHMNPRNLRNLLSWSHKTHPSIMLNTTLMRETHRETGTRESRMRIRVYLLLLQLVEPVSMRCSACGVERPWRLHHRLSNTSSSGMFSCRGTRNASHHSFRPRRGGSVRSGGTKEQDFYDVSRINRAAETNSSMKKEKSKTGVDWAGKRREPYGLKVAGKSRA